VQDDARLERVRAFVKIQDGCSFSCNFCVIPLVRGGTRSRSADAVLREVRRRVAQGHREIVLTGINLGCFRDRAAGYTLARTRP
jgi:2-methylthioadenine synthetase